MTARTHDAFALASLVTAAAFFPPASLNLPTIFAAVIGNNIGALIPDMDSAGNRLWDLLPAGDHLGKIFKRVFYKHRTLSHSFMGIFLIYQFFNLTLPFFLNPDYINTDIVISSIMIGVISHIFADSLTEEGVPLLFPINISFGFPPVSSWRIKTGKWFEKFIVYPAVWLYLFWFVQNFKDQLTQVISLIIA